MGLFHEYPNFCQFKAGTSALAEGIVCVCVCVCVSVV